MPRLAAIIAALFVCAGATPAALPPPAKRLPPAGIELPAAERAELTAAAAALRADLEATARELAPAPGLAAFLPDAEIFHKAVDWALRYDEFFDRKHVAVARRLLALGHERAAQLRQRATPWTKTTGVVLRGHRSKLDGSVQPYAITVPAEWSPGDAPRRLDVVLLGRGEKRTELGFMVERERPPGGNDLVPAGAFVLHPYGRYCNATKFAGEVDVFEAMEAVRRDYAIDPDRVVVRGFSMGGASTWHLAVHHPDRWVAASPGAGFAETPIYAKVLAPGREPRPEWEQRLWRWYDATGYAANLGRLPTIAYAGERDPQILASELMARAMAGEGLTLERLIGPDTEHKFHPESKARLAARLDELVARGRNPAPAVEHFTTYTLRYPGAGRIRMLELGQHWERADVRLEQVSSGRVNVTTRNVVAFTLALDVRELRALQVDGQPVNVSGVDSSTCLLVREGGRWAERDARYAAERWQPGRRKVPGLTGPIMDAFMEPFLFVRPTGQPLNATVGRWAEAELAHAVKLWRDLFRGELEVKDDTAVTEADVAEKHLVLWGDPASNAVLRRMLGQLPLQWDGGELSFRGRTYVAEHHALILIFPNPLTSERRYVVLNSGVDFRDEAYGTNSLQVPKLPDFAIIDLREPPGPRWPGRIVDAGFFDETWR